jgi:hypothetical protein
MPNLTEDRLSALPAEVIIPDWRHVTRDKRKRQSSMESEIHTLA